jgi:polar amino acid transport system substrate-binding protein
MANKRCQPSRLPLPALLGVAALLGGAAVRAACGPYDVAMYKLGSLYYLDERTDSYVGIDKDVVDEVARRTGCLFKPFVESRVRIWAHLADGSLDMSVSGIPNPEREQFARFVVYFRSRNYLLVRNDRAARIDSLEAFTADPTLRLAIVKSFRHGASYDPWIQTLRAQGRVHEYSDPEIVARMVSLGHADAFLAMPTAWDVLLKRYQLEGKVDFVDASPDDRIAHGLILSRKRVSDEDVQSMKWAIEAMRADGTLEAIFRRHLPSDVARRILP